MTAAPHTHRRGREDPPLKAGFSLKAKTDTVGSDAPISEQKEKKEVSLHMNQVYYTTYNSKFVPTNSRYAGYQNIYSPDEDGGIRILPVTAAVVVIPAGGAA